MRHYSKAFGAARTVLDQLMCWFHMFEAFKENLKVKATVKWDRKVKGPGGKKLPQPESWRCMKVDVHDVHEIPYPQVRTFKLASHACVH